MSEVPLYRELEIPGSRHTFDESGATSGGCLVPSPTVVPHLSLTRKRIPIGPYRGPMPGLLGGS